MVLRSGEATSLSPSSSEDDESRRSRDEDRRNDAYHGGERDRGYRAVGRDGRRR